MLPGFSGWAGQDLVWGPAAFGVLRCSAPTLFTFQPSPTVGVITEVTVVLGFRELQSINLYPRSYIHVEDHLDSPSTLVFVPSSSLLYWYLTLQALFCSLAQ